ncbi:MAG: hypothetical protein DDT33_01330 [Firmicutes bacterium]|nr:hypothetical protein [Bacillota bacterium]
MNEFPKGMAIPEVAAPKIVVPFNLGCGNYIQAIYQALDALPIEIRVEKCIVLEKHGEPPEVRLTLRILGTKEKEECRGAEISN